MKNKFTQKFSLEDLQQNPNIITGETTPVIQEKKLAVNTETTSKDSPIQKTVTQSGRAKYLEAQENQKYIGKTFHDVDFIYNVTGIDTNKNFIIQKTYRVNGTKSQVSYTRKTLDQKIENSASIPDTYEKDQSEQTQEKYTVPKQIEITLEGEKKIWNFDSYTDEPTYIVYYTDGTNTLKVKYNQDNELMAQQLRERVLELKDTLKKRKEKNLESFVNEKEVLETIINSETTSTENMEQHLKSPTTEKITEEKKAVLLSLGWKEEDIQQASPENIELAVTYKWKPKQNLSPAEEKKEVAAKQETEKKLIVGQKFKGMDSGTEYSIYKITPSGLVYFRGTNGQEKIESTQSVLKLIKGGVIEKIENENPLTKNTPEQKIETRASSHETTLKVGNVFTNEYGMTNKIVKMDANYIYLQNTNTKDVPIYPEERAEFLHLLDTGKMVPVIPRTETTPTATEKITTQIDLEDPAIYLKLKELGYPEDFLYQKITEKQVKNIIKKQIPFEKNHQLQHVFNIEIQETRKVRTKNGDNLLKKNGLTPEIIEILTDEDRKEFIKKLDNGSSRMFTEADRISFAPRVKEFKIQKITEQIEQTKTDIEKEKTELSKIQTRLEEIRLQKEKIIKKGYTELVETYPTFETDIFLAAQTERQTKITNLEAEKELEGEKGAKKIQDELEELRDIEKNIYHILNVPEMKEQLEHEMKKDTDNNATLYLIDTLQQIEKQIQNSYNPIEIERNKILKQKVIEILLKNKSKEIVVSETATEKELSPDDMAKPFVFEEVSNENKTHNRPYTAENAEEIKKEIVKLEEQVKTLQEKIDKKNWNFGVKKLEKQIHELHNSIEKKCWELAPYRSFTYDKINPEYKFFTLQSNEIFDSSEEELSTNSFRQYSHLKTNKTLGKDQGFFDFTTAGFYLVIQNVSEIKNDKGIATDDEKARYRIIGPDGTDIAKDLPYTEAYTKYSEAANEYEKTLQEQYNQVEK